MSIFIVILSLFLQYVDSLFVCLSEKTWSKAGDIVQRRQTSYDIARILLMVPFEPWENFIPHFLVWQPSVQPKLTISGPL